MTHKHTPGPWRISEFGGMKSLDNEGGLAVAFGEQGSDSVGQICVVTLQDQSIPRKNRWQSQDIERDANAALITAARDLLAALQKIVSNWNNLHTKDLQRALAAIDKADIFKAQH